MSATTIDAVNQQPTTSNQPAAEPRRAPRMPSNRDFHIFRMAEILGLTHERIASACNLTRRRVSQIVEIVRDWLSNNPCDDPQLATELQRKRLAQHTERMRLEDVIERARAALELAPTHLSTVTVKADGSESTTRREQPPVDVQVLKTYLRAIQALGKFHQQPEVPYPPPADGEYPWAKAAMDEVLTRWYHRIWSRSLKIENFYDFAQELIGAFIKALRLQQPAPEQTSEVDDQSAGDEQREGQAPAEPECAVGNALRGVPCATNGSDDDTPAQTASEGHVPSLTTAADTADTAASDSSFIPPPSSDVRRGSPDPAATSTEGLSSGMSDDRDAASLASQREAPAPEQSISSADAVTSSSLDTSAPFPPTEIDQEIASISQENLKREVPSPALDPGLPLSLSPCLRLLPPSTTGHDHFPPSG